MFHLGLGMIGIYALTSVFFVVFPVKVDRKIFLFLWMLYVLGMSIVGYFIEPGESLDLYRMYREIDQFKIEGRHIFSSPMILLNLLYWIVAKTGHNGWYVFLSVLSTGLLQMAVINKYLKENSYSSRAVSLFFLVCNSGCFIVYFFIGRSVLVAALFVYAYYVWHNKNKTIYYGLMICASLIHTFGLVLLLFTMVYDISCARGTKKLYFLTFAVLIGIGYILNTEIPIAILEKIGMGYGEMLSEKWQAYSIRDYRFQQEREMIFRIISSAYIFCCIVYLHFKKETQYELYGFLILIMYVGFDFSIIFERMPYVIGMASLPILNLSITKSNRLLRLTFLFVGLIIFGAMNLWGLYETSLWLDFRI